MLNNAKLIGSRSKLVIIIFLVSSAIGSQTCPRPSRFLDTFQGEALQEDDFYLIQAINGKSCWCQCLCLESPCCNSVSATALGGGRYLCQFSSVTAPDSLTNRNKTNTFIRKNPNGDENSDESTCTEANGFGHSSESGGAGSESGGDVGSSGGLGIGTGASSGGAGTNEGGDTGTGASGGNGVGSSGGTNVDGGTGSGASSGGGGGPNESGGTGIEGSGDSVNNGDGANDNSSGEEVATSAADSNDGSSEDGSSNNEAGGNCGGAGGGGASTEAGANGASNILGEGIDTTVASDGGSSGAGNDGGGGGIGGASSGSGDATTDKSVSNGDSSSVDGDTSAADDGNVSNSGSEGTTTEAAGANTGSGGATSEAGGNDGSSNSGSAATATGSEAASSSIGVDGETTAGDMSTTEATAPGGDSELTVVIEHGETLTWESPNYNGVDHYPDGDYCSWLNVTIPATYTMFMVTLQVDGPGKIADTSQCSGDRISKYPSAVPTQSFCGDLTGQAWQEIAMFDTPLRFAYQFCSVSSDGETDIGFKITIKGKDTSLGK